MGAIFLGLLGWVAIGGLIWFFGWPVIVVLAILGVICVIAEIRATPMPEMPDWTASGADSRRQDS